MSIHDFLERNDALQFIEISNGKVPDEEFVILQANENIQTMHAYIIFDNTYDEDNHTPENIFQHFYWFLNVPVNKDEFICLITGNHKEGEKYFRFEHEDGKVMHYFFWGAKKCVWNNKGDQAHLFKINLPQLIIDIPPSKNA